MRDSCDAVDSSGASCYGLPKLNRLSRRKVNSVKRAKGSGIANETSDWKRKRERLWIVALRGLILRCHRCTKAPAISSWAEPDFLLE
jgi:hypothetical protein